MASDSSFGFEPRNLRVEGLEYIRGIALSRINLAAAGGCNALERLYGEAVIPDEEIENEKLATVTPIRANVTQQGQSSEPAVTEMVTGMDPHKVPDEAQLMRQIEYIHRNQEAA